MQNPSNPRTTCLANAQRTLNDNLRRANLLPGKIQSTAATAAAYTLYFAQIQACPR